MAIAPERASEQDAPAPGKRRRRSRRREQIIAVAVRLFRERGYHAVGIDDIGAAAGITGPGVYRHFRSKQDLLAAVIWQAAEQILAQAEREIESGSPRSQLQHLIEFMVDVVVDGRELTAIYVREFRHLSETDRARLRLMYLRYVEDWQRVLRKVRPDMSDRDARIVVEAIVWLVRSVAFYQPEVDPQLLKTRLTSMALAACLAGGNGSRALKTKPRSSAAKATGARRPAAKR